MRRRAIPLVILGLAGATFGYCQEEPQVETRSELSTAEKEALLKEMERYAGARTLLDSSPEQLLRDLPELHELEFASEQGQLTLILSKVGETVAAFFRDFPNTTAFEQIRQERLGPNGKVEERQNQTFRYLAVARPQANEVLFEEYRASKKGKRVEVRFMHGMSFVTSGFVSMPDQFHPRYQPEANYRYLGMQNTEGRKAYVVAFAQVPEKARLFGRFGLGDHIAALLLQGVAWIDPATYQIVRMHSDLLAPRFDIFLSRQSTDAQFSEVQFKSGFPALWLPREVVVTIEWRGQLFRNYHHYSDFKLFKVETEEKRQPLGVGPSPQ